MSSASGEEFSGAKCIDEVLTGKESYCETAETRDKFPWIALQFEKPVEVRSVIMYERTDEETKKTKNVDVRTSYLKMLDLKMKHFPCIRKLSGVFIVDKPQPKPKLRLRLSIQS